MRGNPGKRAINRREPNAGPLDLACPDEVVSDRARSEWDRIVPAMITCGQVTAADRAVLIGYCNLWAEFVTATSTSTRWALFDKLRRTCAELGMTPAGRSRVHVAAAPAKSSWADVLP
jgi:phage terminase small subunit